jgi:DNA-binding protein HU-beta
MNKAELVSELANRTKSTQAEAKAFLEAFTEVVGDVLKNGDKITLVGFGTFAE